LVAQLGELQHRAQHCLSRRIDRQRERFDLVTCRWPSPQTMFAPTVQRLDEIGERLPRSLSARAGTARGDFNLVAGRLRSDLIAQRIARLGERLSAAWKMAELAHPERPLAKGYVRVTTRDGATLTTAAAARAAQEVTLRFGDGAVDATTGGAGPMRLVEPKRRKPYIAPQPGLFDPAEE
jgi:exodeoxyribonuclease VII large subunit